MSAGQTIALPFCEVCPPLREWPAKHLIYGTCPRCGALNVKAWRELVARRLVA